MRKAVRPLALVVMISASVSIPRVAAAQDGSHWGVAASFTPKWTVPDRLKVVFDADEVDLESSDFTIGVARGRQTGGDWSVSFVRKAFKDGSSISDIGVDCGAFVNGCFANGESLTTQNVRLNGVLAVKFIPFVTIHRRVQIGITLGGGVGTLSGTLDRRVVFADYRFDGSGQPSGVQEETHETVDAKELFPFSPVPLGVVQISGGVMVAPGLKIRATGGLDFPGSSKFTIYGVYLIGAK